MAYQIGLNALHLRPTPRIAHTEYCSNDALKRHLGARGVSVAVTGQDFGGRNLTANENAPRFEDLWDVDFIWHTDDGPIPWSARGRVTDMGHGDFLEGGVDVRPSQPSPFKDIEEVFAFDAVKEYGLPDIAGLVAHYENRYQRARRESYPNQVYTGGYYRTIISGAIESFGWDLLLEAAADQRRFEKVLDSFFRLTLHHVQAWAQTSIEAFIQHDDFVWTMGAFMAPAFYRSAITPRYAELWKVLHRAGKRVLFCSDGNWIDLVDDIAAAGADGFIFEPMMPLEPVVERFGKSHVIISSKVDARTLTFGTRAQIQAEVDATLPLAFKCPGFIWAVGNHIPSNVPVANALFYFDYLRRRWERG